MIFITVVTTGFKEWRPEVKKLHNFNCSSINHLKDAVSAVRLGDRHGTRRDLNSRKIPFNDGLSRISFCGWSSILLHPETIKWTHPKSRRYCVYLFPIALHPLANKPGWTCVLMPHMWHRQTTTASLTHLQLVLIRPSCVWNISPCVTTSPWKCHTHHLLIRCFFILKRWIPSSQWPEKGAAGFQLWKYINACLTLQYWEVSPWCYHQLFSPNQQVTHT